MRVVLRTMAPFRTLLAVLFSLAIGAPQSSTSASWPSEDPGLQFGCGCRFDWSFRGSMSLDGDLRILVRRPQPSSMIRVLGPVGDLGDRTITSFHSASQTEASQNDPYRPSSIPGALPGPMSLGMVIHASTHDRFETRHENLSRERDRRPVVTNLTLAERGDGTLDLRGC